MMGIGGNGNAGRGNRRERKQHSVPIHPSSSESEFRESKHLDIFVPFVASHGRCDKWSTVGLLMEILNGCRLLIFAVAFNNLQRVWYRVSVQSFLAVYRFMVIVIPVTIRPSRGIEASGLRYRDVEIRSLHYSNLELVLLNLSQGRRLIVRMSSQFMAWWHSKLNGMIMRYTNNMNNYVRCSPQQHN